MALKPGEGQRALEGFLITFIMAVAFVFTIYFFIWVMSFFA